MFTEAELQEKWESLTFTDNFIFSREVPLQLEQNTEIYQKTSSFSSVPLTHLTGIFLAIPLSTPATRTNDSN